MTAGGTLYVVGTPIGNLEDMSPRATRILREVVVLAAEDTRTARSLLRHLGIEDKKTIVSYFEGNEAKRAEELVASLEGGEDVALISEAGMPGISDPGQRLVSSAREKGLDVVVIPGPSAALTALVGSGLASREFRFIGFPPRNRGARQKRFGQLRRETATLVLYESPERAQQCLEDLIAAFGGERPAYLARELTKRYEEFRGCTLQEVLSSVVDDSPRGECTLVVAGASDEADEVEDIEGAVRELLQRGLGPKDVAARLIVKTGRPRRELYQLALSLQRENDDSQT
jgi:16S rRNA (cytidine1402-2'-O)-methyltransferase